MNVTPTNIPVCSQLSGASKKRYQQFLNSHQLQIVSIVINYSQYFALEPATRVFRIKTNEIKSEEEAQSELSLSIAVTDLRTPGTTNPSDD